MTWHHDGDWKTQKSKVLRGAWSQEKRCLETRSISHYRSNQRKRNAKNLRARDLRKRKSAYSQVNWRFEARGSETGWREEETNSCFDDRGRAYKQESDWDQALESPWRKIAWVKDCWLQLIKGLVRRRAFSWAKVNPWRKRKGNPKTLRIIRESFWQTGWNRRFKS